MRDEGEFVGAVDATVWVSELRGLDRERWVRTYACASSTAPRGFSMLAMTAIESTVCVCVRVELAVFDAVRLVSHTGMCKVAGWTFLSVQSRP